MDLNASPLPDEDDQTYEEPVDIDFGQDEDHIESAVEIMRRVNKTPSCWKFYHVHASV
jgi:mRNA-capping enzyme